MRELITANEQWNIIPGTSDGEFHRLIVIWKEGDPSRFYLNTDLTVRMSQLTDTMLHSLPPGDPIPREHYCGSWKLNDTSSTLTEAPTPPPPHTFLKSRSLVMYDGTPSIGERLMTEARILEQLARNPHPNIVVYYGCVREGDLVPSLCLKQYPSTLEDEIHNIRLSPDHQRLILSGLASGLSHLHAMGLVHNDLNPSNIMLDDDGSTPVIIDFDICATEGVACGPGTPGWGRPGAGREPCTKENDLYALGLIKRYLEGDYEGTDYAFE